nr:MAG TPA_asm: Portal [Caudoviricetes sp.]
MHGGTCLLYMKYSPIGISPDQAQFLETRKFQIDEIARIFRVPPHMIGDLEKSTFSNIEQQSLEFVKYTLGPWVSRWEQAMSQALLTPEECSCTVKKQATENNR